MGKELNLNINPLVSLLTTLFSCGKNSVYKAKDIAYRLIQSAVHNQSLEAIYRLTEYLSADRMLNKLHKISAESARELMMKSNKKIKLPKKVTLAIDFTDKLYYGNKNHPEIMGSKKGEYVRRYIELSTVYPPLCIDVLPVNQLTNDKEALFIELLDTFYKQYKKVGISLLLIDRGFFAKKVIQLLMNKNIPFIMPAIKDKAIMKLVEAYKRGEIKSRIKYKFGDATINLLFLKIEDEVLVYATNTRKSILAVHLSYDKRWQIETNFREQNKFAIRTCSKDFNLRYFIFIIGGLLFNAWQLTRRLVPYVLESYLFKQFLVEELLSLWQMIAKKEVVKTSYILSVA